MAQLPYASSPLAKSVDGQIIIDSAWYRFLVDLQAQPELVDPLVSGTINYNLAGVVPQVDANDVNTVSVANVATLCVAGDLAMWFVAHDRSSGGMSVGVMDATGGVVITTAGIANVNFARSAGVGLMCNTTGGVTPRSISFYAIAVGVP